MLRFNTATDDISIQRYYPDIAVPFIFTGYLIEELAALIPISIYNDWRMT
jgi:hypothetical protein